MVPFVDPLWMQDWYSPYYGESHMRLARWMRDLMETEVFPYADEWEEAGEVPSHVYRRFAELGVVALHFAPDFPEIYDILPKGWPIPAGLKREEIDVFHKHVVLNELQRVGSAGIMGGVY